MKRMITTTSALTLLAPLTALAMGVQVIIDGQSVVFSDVPQSAWYATYVRQSAEAGIVSGYKDSNGKLTGKYGPSNRITVAEALKIAVEAAGYNVESYSNSINSGVDHWSSAYVSVAKGDGFEVIDEGANLDMPATRAEVAALFTSAFDVDLETPIGNNYDDVGFQTEYGFSIEALTRDDVVSGDTDINGQSLARFRPLDAINRAEVAKIAIEARAAYGTPGTDKSPSEQSSSSAEEHLVTYTNTGFSPQVLRIQKGETVGFRNDTTSQLWVASDPHPVHTDLSAFDAGQAMAQGETYFYTFTQIGSWSYHNHLNASMKGTIIVE